MTNKRSYSATELAEMKLPHLPTTKKGWLDLVKREKWISVTVPGGRGCKGGLKREYYPSKAVEALIESAQNIDQEANKSKHYSISTATNLVTGSEFANITQDPLAPPAVLNDFVFVPQYDVSASAGHGSTVHSEQIVDHLAFKKAWISTELGCHEKSLALITVKGDSMEPTLSSGDLILVNLQKNQIVDNAVYVLQYDGSLLVKRIQRLMNGSVIIKSDNPDYREEELSADQVGLLRVLGMVVWYGRKI